MELDTRGLKCPLPVLKLEKQLEHIRAGATLIVLADDPVARIDIPLMCQRAGHACTISRTADAMRFAITKTGSLS